MHEGSALLVGTFAVGHGMDQCARFVEDVHGGKGDLVGFRPSVVKVFQKHGYIVIRIVLCIAPCPRSKQHHALDTVAVQTVNRGAEFSQDERVCTCHASCLPQNEPFLKLGGDKPHVDLKKVDLPFTR